MLSICLKTEIRVRTYFIVSCLSFHVRKYPFLALQLDHRAWTLLADAFCQCSSGPWILIIDFFTTLKVKTMWVTVSVRVQFQPGALRQVHTGACCTSDRQDHEVVWVYGRNSDIELWLINHEKGILSAALMAGESRFAKHPAVNLRIT